MSYEQALTQIVAEHRPAIEADLETAREECGAATTRVAHMERRLLTLEALLSIGVAPTESESAPDSPSPPTGDSEPVTLHAAMHRVLKASPTGKLRAGEIIAEIDRLGLYRMRDGRLPESQQIHARAGRYADMFGKDGPYFFAK
jgi:hypothetical protein